MHSLHWEIEARAETTRDTTAVSLRSFLYEI
jgi:hypothetical protein